MTFSNCAEQAQAAADTEAGPSSSKGAQANGTSSSKLGISAEDQQELFDDDDDDDDDEDLDDDDDEDDEDVSDDELDALEASLNKANVT